MKLVVLADNNTFIDKYFVGEPGLSFYIEDKNTKILFDTGYSNIFLSNAEKLNINLNNIDYLVLSHGHNDHTGGLRFLDSNILKKVRLIAHPNIFVKRSHNDKEIGSFIKLENNDVKEFISTDKPYKITDNLYYLGQINRNLEFENRSIGYLNNGKEDIVEDDSALVYKTKSGLFIITACSHSGICNIVEQAKALFNENRIVGIIGGFHLLNDDNQLKETIKYFKDNNINELYPCHCVSLTAKAKMMDVAKVHEVGVGLKLEID